MRKVLFFLLIFSIIIVNAGCYTNTEEIFPNPENLKRDKNSFSGYKLVVNLPFWGKAELDGLPVNSEFYLKNSSLNSFYVKNQKSIRRLNFININSEIKKVIFDEKETSKSSILQLRDNDDSYEYFITTVTGLERSKLLNDEISLLINSSDFEITREFPFSNSSSVKEISNISPKLISNIQYGDSFYVPMTQGTYYLGRFFHPVVYEKDLPENNWKKWEWKWDTFSAYVPEGAETPSLLLYIPAFRSCKETMLGFAQQINQGKKKYIVISTDLPYHGKRSEDPNFTCGLTNPDKFTGNYNPSHLRKMLLESFIEALYFVRGFTDFGFLGYKFKNVVVLSHSLGSVTAAMFHNLKFVLGEIYLDPYYTLKDFLPKGIYNSISEFDLKKVLWSFNIVDAVSPITYSEQFNKKPVLLILAENDEVVPLYSQIEFSDKLGIKCQYNDIKSSVKECIIFKGAKHKSIFVHKVSAKMKKSIEEFLNNLPD